MNLRSRLYAHIELRAAAAVLDLTEALLRLVVQLLVRGLLNRSEARVGLRMVRAIRRLSWRLIRRNLGRPGA